MMKNNLGATLLELMIVLAIIAVVASLIVIGPGFTGTDKVKSVSRELLGDLQKLRMSAMTQREDDAAPQMRGFGIRLESVSTYRLFRFNDSNSNFIYDGVSEESPLPGEFSVYQRNIPAPIEIRINSHGDLNKPDNKVLIFDFLGYPRNADWGFSQVGVVIQHPYLDDIQKKCVSVSFNRIREGIWNENKRDCKEQ